uniref:Uncharacterized protein n=1 Tax=Oryza glumipatula TaxID=40148 RepID=A0A0D9Z5P4_9ORYZ
MVWLQDNFGWLVGFGVPALCTVLAMASFLLGSAMYRYHQAPASWQNCGAILPGRRRRHQEEERRAASRQLRPLRRSAKVRAEAGAHRPVQVLGQRGEAAAAVAVSSLVGGEAAAAAAQPWRLCTVTQVDELKVIVRMLPVWARATGIVYCMVLVQQPLFTVQGRAMRRRLGFGAGAFAIPAASLHSVYAAAMLILVPLYDAAVVPAVRRLTSNERGLTEMQRIGAGMTLSVAAMAAAATVEGRRLAVGKAAARLGSGKRRAEQQFGGGGDGAVSATTSSPRRQRGAGCWKRRARPWRRTS